MSHKPRQVFARDFELVVFIMICNESKLMCDSHYYKGLNTGTGLSKPVQERLNSCILQFGGHAYDDARLSNGKADQGIHVIMLDLLETNFAQFVELLESRHQGEGCNISERGGLRFLKRCRPSETPSTSNRCSSAINVSATF
jgi:hypothetical protein